MKRQVWGFIIVLLGVLALLQGTGQFNFGLSFWPVVGALAGFSLLWRSMRKVSWLGIAAGLWLLAMGVVSMVAQAGVALPMGLDPGMVAKAGWPLMIIAIGVSVMFGRSRMSMVWDFSGKSKRGTVGEVHYGRHPWHLDDDLFIEHGVGDIKIDLSTATISEGHHLVNVKAGMGEIVIRVPDNVSVEVEAKGGVGEITVLGDTRNGLGLHISRQQIVPESKVSLRIDANLGVGSMRIVSVPATPNFLIIE